VTLANFEALRARVAAEAHHRKLPDELIEPFTDAFVASLITHSGRPAGAEPPAAGAATAADGEPGGPSAQGGAPTTGVG
jgi:hypothetical protein